MKLKVLRLGDSGDSTLSTFYINGILKSTGCEDEERTKKVFNETRVPNGIYSVKLREEGGFNARYKTKFNDPNSKHYMGNGWHKGMLCIHNEEDWKLCNNGMTFQYVLIHIGNDDDDTAGCYLVGRSMNLSDFTIGDSTSAYKRIYPIIRDAILAGEEVTIEYVDVEDGK